MTDSTEQEFGIHSVYLKDVSFEAPNSPEIFKSQFQPDIQMNLNLETNSLDNDIFEVVLAVTVEAKVKDKSAFLVELQQAGVFTVKGFSEENIGPMLGIYCPNILFPYARESVANLVTKGGFPQLLLEPVNFEALYTQHVEQQSSSVQ